MNKCIGASRSHASRLGFLTVLRSLLEPGWSPASENGDGDEQWLTDCSCPQPVANDSESPLSVANSTWLAVKIPDFVKKQGFEMVHGPAGSMLRALQHSHWLNLDVIGRCEAGSSHNLSSVNGQKFHPNPICVMFNAGNVGGRSDQLLTEIVACLAPDEHRIVRLYQPPRWGETATVLTERG